MVRNGDVVLVISVSSNRLEDTQRSSGESIIKKMTITNENSGLKEFFSYVLSSTQMACVCNVSRHIDQYSSTKYKYIKRFYLNLISMHSYNVQSYQNCSFNISLTSIISNQKSYHVSYVRIQTTQHRASKRKGVAYSLQEAAQSSEVSSKSFLQLCRSGELIRVWGFPNSLFVSNSRTRALRGRGKAGSASVVMRLFDLSTNSRSYSYPSRLDIGESAV